MIYKSFSIVEIDIKLVVFYFRRHIKQRGYAMRKLLLSSTALATAAALTAGAAVADVSISAATDWQYNSRSSQIAASDGTFFSNDSEIAFKFTNKTDSGLDIGYTVEMFTDDGEGTIDESSISISGGFGKIVLGNQDGAADNYGLNALDLIAEESSIKFMQAAGTTSSISTNSDIQIGSDANKIAYHLPAMGGFTAGASIADSGAAATANAGTDTTEYGFQYTMDAGGNTITIAAASATTEAPTKDTDSQALAVKVVAGNLSIIASQSTLEGVDEDRNNVGVGVSYNMGNGMVLGAYTNKSEDDLDIGEELSLSGVEVQYTIAAGLTAAVTVEDYDYKVTAANHENTPLGDKGTVSKLTITAAF